jgi:hypothetical protein
MGKDLKKNKREDNLKKKGRGPNKNKMEDDLKHN